MITGMKIRVKMDELKHLLLSKASYHENEVERNKKKIAALGELATEFEPSTSNYSGKGAASGQIEHHGARAKYYRFLAEHLFGDYELSLEDINELGILN